MHLPGAADTAAHLTYIGEILSPILKQGDIVVMNNLAMHKSPRVAALVQAVRTELRFVFACSPDLNPIEKMWSRVKASLDAF